MKTTMAFVAGITVSLLAAKMLGLDNSINPRSGSGAAGADRLSGPPPPSPEIKAIQAGMQELLDSKRRSVRLAS